MPTFVSSQMLQDSVLPRFSRLDCFNLNGKIYKKWKGRLTLVFGDCLFTGANGGLRRIG